MAFFSGLLSIAFLIWLFSRFIKKGPFQDFWKAAQVSTILMFVQVGLMHLISPQSFVYMIEGIVPYPNGMVLLSGITEIIFAFGLIWIKTRKMAAVLLILQLLAMFPANINVAVKSLAAPGGLPSEDWYVWSRLIFQPVYIYWIYLSFLRKRAGRTESRQSKRSNNNVNFRKGITRPFIRNLKNLTK